MSDRYILTMNGDAFHGRVMQALQHDEHVFMWLNLPGHENRLRPLPQYDAHVKDRRAYRNGYKNVEEEACQIRLKAKLEAEERANPAYQERMKERFQERLPSKVKEQSPLTHSLEHLHQSDPFDFESIVAEMFRSRGYEVEQTPKTNDLGRDAIMFKNGKKVLLECKRYALESTCGRPDIQKFRGAIANDEADFGFFVTTGGFTKDALDYVDGKNVIKLVNGRDLIKMLDGLL